MKLVDMLKGGVSGRFGGAGDGEGDNCAAIRKCCGEGREPRVTSLRGGVRDSASG